MESYPDDYVPGFYIAWHWLLDHIHGPKQVFKVGFTRDLRARLLDSAYVTCWPAKWRYIATLETQHAHDIETAVLREFHNFRIDGTELVNMTADVILASAVAAANNMGLTIIRRYEPTYLAPERCRETVTKVPHPLEDARPLEDVALEDAPLEDVAEEALPLANFDDMLDDLIDKFVPPIRGIAIEVITINVVPKIATNKEDVLMGDGTTSIEIALDEFAEGASPIDLAGEAPLEERQYQDDAVAGCLAELRERDRAVLQMACRCGKTRVSHRIFTQLMAETKLHVLYLVPSLPLLRQTAQKINRYGTDAPILLVGSDPRPVTLADGRILSMTTNVATIDAFMNSSTGLVISTYQSSPLVPDIFGLIVFDECHRTCGGSKQRPFNHVLLRHQMGQRLYMTATPRMDGAINMKDQALFGRIAYQYHLRQGIDAGYVNNFELILVAADDNTVYTPDTLKQYPLHQTCIERARQLPAQICRAHKQSRKLLVFCRLIDDAKTLCEQVRIALRAAGESTLCLLAHSGMPGNGVAASLRAFCESNHPAILFNCQLLQEGVELQPLTGIFFAAPRYSARDIIQCICRALNTMPGKPISRVFLPVDINPDLPAESPENLKRFAAIVPFVEALLSEDPRLYNHLLNPDVNPYPIGWMGTHSDPTAMLKAARRAMRYTASSDRLMRNERVPFSVGYAELKRTIEDCNRYPKSSDGWRDDRYSCFHSWYKWIGKEYRKWVAGEKTTLQLHQVHQLETLPEWQRYGLNTPYPHAKCLAYLEQWLDAHDGEFPMVEIQKGEYGGLSATPMERLSGLMRVVNMQDATDYRKGVIVRPGYGLKLDPAISAEMDRICEKWHLRWRKDRDDNGGLDEVLVGKKGKYRGRETIIQTAYKRFKQHYALHKDIPSDFLKEHYPEYPKKHKMQCEVRSYELGLEPPKYKSRPAEA